MSGAATRRCRRGTPALYVAISQVLAQPADKYNVDFAGVRGRPGAGRTML